MEKVILELVEFDRQAQKAVRAAEERSASERARIVQEKEALSARYRERAKQTIQKLEHRKRQEAELELQKFEARYGDSMKRLEESFRQQERFWVDEIVKRCRQE